MTLQEREAIKQIATQIEYLAFQMPPPNTFTPQFLMLATALRAALAQPEPKPVAWVDRYDFDRLPHHDCYINGVQTDNSQVPLYIALPKREWQEGYKAGYAQAQETDLAIPCTPKEWVGLTDEEYELMAEKRVTNYFFNTLDYAHDIEAKLKEKNT